MQKRLITEYEWRKRFHYSTKKPAWFGPQCVYSLTSKRKINFCRIKNVIFLLLAFAAFLCLKQYASSSEMLLIEAFEAVPSDELQVRHVSSVSYQLPMDLEWNAVILTREELMRGKMMLLDQNHLLPADALPPNTLSILRYGNGMIPLRSLTLKTGEETLSALKGLFSDLRERKIGGIYVCQGTMSKQQQKSEMLKQVRSLMHTLSPNEAVQAVRLHMDEPGTGELLQEYTVDLCVMDKQNQPNPLPLEQTEQGQTLLQLSWRHGFIRSAKERPLRFRFVGKAHATAMTYLALELETYLNLLHQRERIVISSEGKPQYLILCQPIRGDRISFDIPAGASYEASLDNTGYAIVACTL